MPQNEACNRLSTLREAQFVEMEEALQRMATCPGLEMGAHTLKSSSSYEGVVEVVVPAWPMTQNNINDLCKE
jgi:hypothetical protein